MPASAARKLTAEALGTALLLAVVIGSGIMAERLSGGNSAIALLANTLATVGGLYVLIEVFGPISGAHFNPAVSLVMTVRRAMPGHLLAPYAAAQLLGAMLGAWLANAMFDLSILQFSTKARSGTGQWIAEGVATFGLMLVLLRAPPARVAAMVAAYIGAAYWFTASTSFANPAAAYGRMFSDSFAGIAPASVCAFVLAELAGTAIALLVHRLLEAAPREPATPRNADSPDRPPHPMPEVTIYHNPACGTSRNTLALIRHAGIEPVVVEYLETPPSKEKLRDLIAAMGISARDLLRRKEAPCAELGLDDAALSDDQLLDAMLAHPILINRPIVVTGLGTRLCRPSEAVLELLPVPKLVPFTKEDGEVVVDSGKRRDARQDRSKRAAPE